MRKSNPSNRVKSWLSGTKLSELVRIDPLAYEAAMSAYDGPESPGTRFEVECYGIAGMGYRPTPMDCRLCCESKKPFPGGSFEDFCEHFVVVEWFNAELGNTA